jgi:hypothetical protein
MKINKYRIYCTTESNYVYTWNDSEPTICPNNIQHSIDDNTITIIDSVENKTVNIIQENKPTGGNFKAESKKIDITQTGLTTYEFSFPYRISVLTITPFSFTENNGDEICLLVTPNTPIGALTANVNVDDTVLYVNNTVSDNVMVGYYIYIIDNNENIEVGFITNIDKLNGTITIDTPISQTFTTGQYIGINIYLLRDFLLYGNQPYELARKTIGSSTVDTDLTVRIIYHNKTNDNKTFRYSYEYLY